MVADIGIVEVSRPLALVVHGETGFMEKIENPVFYSMFHSNNAGNIEQ